MDTSVFLLQIINNIFQKPKNQAEERVVSSAKLFSPTPAYVLSTTNSIFNQPQNWCVFWGEGEGVGSKTDGQFSVEKILATVTHSNALIFLCLVNNLKTRNWSPIGDMFPFGGPPTDRRKRSHRAAPEGPARGGRGELAQEHLLRRQPRERCAPGPAAACPNGHHLSSSCRWMGIPPLHKWLRGSCNTELG